ncbi:MAG TPA: superoxide dismutase family protein [Mycobacteriales bacterium]|nr:superoxide dismutase family protein [Mycobacteriales bacterium]
MRRTRSALVVVAAFTVSSVTLAAPALGTHPQLAGREDDSPHAAIVVLKDAAGTEVGQATIGDTGQRMLVRVTARGVTPGFHGFHVHSVGQCDGSTTPPFTSAGGHLNPSGAAHGAHDGDMPPLYADAGGGISASFATDAFTSAELYDADGAALILHAGPDNVANIPARYSFTNPDGTTGSGPDSTTRATGDAGARTACGVLPSMSPMNHVGLAPSRSREARAVLRTSTGAVAGVVRLDDGMGKTPPETTPSWTQVSADIAGLTPGFHGFHVHAVGSCDASTGFTSAGGHHGSTESAHGGHRGDLPPLFATTDGRARLETRTDTIGIAQLLDADGAAFVVHASPDNLAHVPDRYRFTNPDGTTGTGPDATTRATGDSGPRVLCGAVYVPPPPASISLSVDVPVITAGNAPRLTATVTDSAGAGAPDVAVTFYATHTVGQKIREAIGTGYTDESGQAHLVVRPADRTGYTADFTTATGSQVISPSRVVEVHSRVVVRSPLPGASVSSPVTFTGQLFPSYGGRPIGLATYVGSGAARRWVYLGQTTTAPDGTFRLTKALPRGAATYVVYVPARAENLRGSTSIPLTVG